jgi:GDP-L-fucose synthase
MIRKIHLCHALEMGRIDEVKQDLLRHQAPEISHNSDEDEVLKYLKRHGIEAEKLGSVFRVSIKLWGSGNPFREFLWSDDMADACVYLMEQYSFNNLLENAGSYEKDTVRNTHVNIGTGSDITIRELAELVKKVVGFKGDIHFDANHPDGTYRKLLDVTKLTQLGWKYQMPLEEGIQKAYQYYITQD